MHKKSGFFFIFAKNQTMRLSTQINQTKISTGGERVISAEDGLAESFLCGWFGVSYANSALHALRRSFMRQRAFAGLVDGSFRMRKSARSSSERFAFAKVA